MPNLHLMPLKFPWKRTSETRTKIVSFHIPTNLLEALDTLVERGIFRNRSEAIRYALYRLISEHSTRGGRVRDLLVVGYR